MFILIGCSVIALITIVAFVKSKKPTRQILREAKFEILYNVVGTKGMIHDYMMKKHNKTDLVAKTGKIAVITGGTRGIGLEVIRMLLKCDITVVIGCRNPHQGLALIDTFKEKGITTGNIEVFKLDISVRSSVEEFANAVKEKFDKIHYLINNAGIMFGPYVESKDGYESQFSTNYLGHFLLTHLLLPEIAAAGEPDSMARIVNVSSCAYVLGEINFIDINNRENYVAGKAYAQSKLAQILFTNYLDDLLTKEKINVQIHSVHPGIVNTELFNGTNLKTLAPWMPNLLFKSPEQGAVSVVHACLSPLLEGKGGTYISNCEVNSLNDTANDVILQEKLFEFTKQLLKIKKFGKPDE